MRQFPPALMQYVEMVPVRLRYVYALALAAVVAVAGGAFYFAKSDNVQLFATSLDSQQLAEVESHLTQDQISYVATADNVFVSASKKGDELFRLLTEGVPHPHLATSAEILKDVSAMTPTAVIAAQTREGLQGDIASNLRGMTGVLDANVIIAPAQAGMFVDEPSHDASASVRLTLDHGVTLPAQSVSGMRSLVAEAVPGLSVEHVGIMDQTGRDLTATSTGLGEADRALEVRLNTTLDTLFGPHMAFATVNVEMQGSSSTSHEIKHVPLQDRAIATDAEREHYVSKNKSYDKVHQNTDRGSDTIETNTQTAAGSIRRKTVAVFVNNRISPQPSIAMLASTIGAAAGIDLSRGDSISVQAIPMAGTPGANVAQPGSGPAIPASIPMLATFPLPMVILMLASVCALSYLGWLYIPQRAEDAKIADFAVAKLAADEFEPVRLHAALRGEPPHTTAAILATLPSPTTTAVLELYGADERREIVKRLTKQISPLVRDVSVQAGRG